MKQQPQMNQSLASQLPGSVKNKRSESVSVVRSDVTPPRGLNLDNPHEENIVGVVTITLSDYSLSATFKGQIPAVSDIASAIDQLNQQDEYSRAFADSANKQ